MKVIKLAVAGSLLLVMLGMSSTARADSVSGTLTLSNCGTDPGCPAATYTFTYTNNSATLEIDIVSGVNSNNDVISSVDLGTNGLNLTGVSVVGPNAGWTIGTGPVTNSGCADNSGSFICANGSVLIAAGGKYTWQWSFNSISDSDVSTLSAVHIGVNYNPADGLIVSETAGAVPEPSSLLLLGTGLLGLGGMIRWRLGT